MHVCVRACVRAYVCVSINQVEIALQIYCHNKCNVYVDRNNVSTILFTTPRSSTARQMSGIRQKLPRSAQMAND